MQVQFSLYITADSHFATRTFDVKSFIQHGTIHKLLIAATIAVMLAKTSVAWCQNREMLTDDKGLVNVSLGIGGLGHSADDFLRYGLEYRFSAFSRWNLRPTIGFIGAENDSSYTFIGLRKDFALSERLVLTPGIDIGSFHEGEAFELGSDFEFHPNVELGYIFANRWRLAVGLSHLSNAGLGKFNPGTNAVLLSLTAPLGTYQ